MIERATGVFAAAPKIAAIPTPAPSSIGNPRIRASTLPNVAPTKKSGVTSPPRKPAASVIADEHPQREHGDPVLEEPLQAMRELHERDRRARHRYTDHAELREDERGELDVRDGRIGRVNNAEMTGHPVANERSNERRDERVVFHASDRDNFEAE